MLPVGVGLFGLGLLAVIAAFALALAGSTGAAWLWAVAMLLPVGLLLAVVSLVRTPRR